MGPSEACRFKMLAQMLGAFKQARRMALNELGLYKKKIVTRDGG